MIPESEWRCCQAPGCGKPIKPHRKEGRGQYALRKFCNRKCRGIVGFKDIPLRKCANPGCQNVVPRDPGMKPCDYARRKSCSLGCARQVMSISARMRSDQTPRKPKTPRDIPKETAGNYHAGVSIRAKKPVPLKAPRLANEAEAIAAFIAQRGITHCPPKYAAPTLNAALPEREARSVVKGLKVMEPRYSSWAWRAQ